MATCVVDKEGTKKWYQNGKLHNDKGPAVEYDDGVKYWYQNGKLHNVKGPAIEWYEGVKEWWFEGELHRIDGPAVEIEGLAKYWYYKGIQMTEEEYERVIALLRKRETRLARWVYQRWYSDWMRDPHTERGQKYISKDYDRMVAELGDEGFITFN